MKKICLMICVLVVLLPILSACVPSQNNSEIPESSQSLQSTEPTQATPPTSETEPTEPETQPTTLPKRDEEPLFTFNPYMISTKTRNDLSDREYGLYQQMVDAVISHSGIVAGFESYEEFEKLWRILIMECVPARSIIPTFRNSEEPFVFENGTATLQFLANKETCDRNYAAFEKIVNEALSLVKADDNDWERIAKLYLYVAAHMDYGNPHTEYGIEANQYNSIVYGLGICGNYADYLNMLANQIGFETIQASSLSNNTAVDVSHAWSLIRIEGNWYHFDACWDTGTLALRYFAISTEERYTSLLTLNTTGLPCEIDMFSMENYTYERTELPLCESGLSQQEREEIYRSVIGEYLASLSKTP